MDLCFMDVLCPKLIIRRGESLKKMEARVAQLIDAGNCYFAREVLYEFEA
jgi:hypothetical protein